MRTAIVTGAYGAIGKAISEGLANHGMRVCLVGRNMARLQTTRDDLILRTGNTEVFYETVDLSLHQSILEFRNRWSGPLHLLVNNAATAPKRRTETSEGIEMQWAANVLGYFWMIHYFSPFMIHQPDARIINVASYWAGGLNLSDPEFKNRPYNNDTAYRQAKQANRMMSAYLAGKLKPLGIMVNACHPCDVNSKLSNAFGFGGHESPEEGAATPLYLALSAEMKEKTGMYYEHVKSVTCQFSGDQAAVDRLYNLLSGMEGL